MEQQPYLIFSLGNSQYGVLAAAVQELFFIPEITPIAEAPSYIAGVINLRGEVLPVINLYQRLGRQALPYQLTDSIIVLRSQFHSVGIIVNQVDEVQMIVSDQIASSSVCRQLQVVDTQPFIAGVAKLEETIVTLLKPDSLLQLPTLEVYPEQNGHSPKQLNPVDTIQDDATNSQDTAALYVHFSLDEQQVLRERANNLRRSLDTQESAELLPLAVVSIGNEYFGLGLEAVYEFTEIHRITPVPCCPAHIIGNINLRGEIITLVNIKALINLPNAHSQPSKKAIVARLDQLVAGITVDDIFDVVYIHPSQIAAPPVAVHSASDDYLQGVASYQDRMMSIIDLPKILTSGALVVNEEV